MHPSFSSPKKSDSPKKDYLNTPPIELNLYGCDQGRRDPLSLGLQPVYRGSNWNNGDNAGPFYLNGNNDFSNWNYNIGARLGIYPKRHLGIRPGHPRDAEIAAKSGASRPLENPVRPTESGKCTEKAILKRK